MKIENVVVSDAAASLYDGGWRPWDRGELKIEYNLTDDETDAIAYQLAEYELNNRHMRDYIASYMRDSIREDLHAKLAPCEFSDFLRAYIDADPEFCELLKTEFGWLYDYWL